jgi:hypothetical protein
VTRCHHNSRSFKWTVQIKKIVIGQFLWYCRGSQSGCEGVILLS